MLHDPKAVMVAAAFLASKAEDSTADIRYLEEGCNRMNAPVSQAEIIPAEIALLNGINFDVLCFHPYKPVLALTEDLRTYLKSAAGRKLVQTTDANRPIVGQDLKPIYDRARVLLEDVIVSDIPLLFSPGQIGLAALILANEILLEKPDSSTPRIDFIGYLRQRFQEEEENKQDMEASMKQLCGMLRELSDGKWGCGNHNVDMAALKSVHKKLKKCRIWDGGSSKKKRKQKGGNGDDDPPHKRPKKS